jgi:hypothetical protein
MLSRVPPLTHVDSFTRTLARTDRLVALGIEVLQTIHVVPSTTLTHVVSFTNAGFRWESRVLATFFLNLVQKYRSYCEKERPKYSVLDALWWILANVDFFGWGKKLQNISSPTLSYVSQNDNQETYYVVLLSRRMFSSVRALSKVAQ